VVSSFRGFRYVRGRDAVSTPAVHREQVDPAAAEEFLALYEAENPGAGPIRSRIEEVRAQIEQYGTYVHTAAELTFGARVAWRNSSRCIGRLYWRSLRVRDRRHVTTAEQVAVEAFAHLPLRRHAAPAPNRGGDTDAAAEAGEPVEEAPRSRWVAVHERRWSG